MRLGTAVPMIAVSIAVACGACGGEDSSVESKSRSDDFFTALTDAGAEPDGAAAGDAGGDGSDGDEPGLPSKPRSDGGDEHEATPMVELPSGRLVFDSDRSGNLDLWLLEAGSDDPRQLTTDEGYDRNPTFVPDGTAVLFQSDRGARPDSPTGLRSYDLYRLDLDTNEETHLLGSRTYNSGQRLTPDGSMLSFASDASGEMHIYFADPDGSSPTQITEENQSNGGPVWSPDGTSAVYSTRSGSDDWDLWIMDADGDNRRALLDGPENDRSADWSPDGQRLVFQSDRDGGEGDYDLFLLDIDSGELTSLTSGPGNDQFPTWSPDGRHVAFDSDRDDTGGARTRTNVYLVEVDTGDVARLTDGDRDSFPDWGP